MKIVGICSVGPGSAGAGKGRVATRLASMHGFTEIGLSDPLKRFAGEMFGWDEKSLWGPSEFRDAPDPRGRSRRRALQLLGDWARAIDKAALTDAMLRDAAAELSGECRYVRTLGAVPRKSRFIPAIGVAVPDVRYLDEVEAIRAVGGLVFGVGRKEAKPLEGAAGSHDSEHGLVGLIPDVVLDFNGTLARLHEQVDTAIGNWLRVAAE